MPRILAIFRKDARCLWPQAAALALLMALAALLDPTYQGGSGLYYSVLPGFALPLACWLLVISVIHQDKLPGDRQYWLTRPYSRADLLAAKILFVAVFVNLPLLAYHAAVYLWLGIPLADHLGALLWRQVFFTAFYILPAAALAVITRSLGRVLAIVLLGGVSLGLVGVAYGFLVRHGLLQERGPGPDTTLAQAVLLAAGVSAIVAVQYAWRRTALAGSLAAALTLACLSVGLYRPARGRSSNEIANRAAGLSLDPDPNRHDDLSLASDPDPYVRGEPNAAFDIPVRLENLPAGVALDQQYLTLRLDAPGRPYTLRLPQGQLRGFSNGRAWLTFLTNRRLLEQLQGQPVEVSGSFDLRLFSSPSVLPVPRGSAVVAPGIGVCRDTLDAEDRIAFSCYSPGPRAALMAGIPGVRANWIISPGSVSNSIPTSADFQPVTRFTSQVSYPNWEQAGELKLIAARPLPPFSVNFRLFPVPLRKYLVADR